jgi:hydroxymethylglutaryl-CoA synthase
MPAEMVAGREEDRSAGVSGMSLYVPRLRVKLEDWCGWTRNSWDKVRSVVGHSFRVCSSRENTYTMAATAVLRLIEKDGVDPRDVGFLGLGTESSRDNAAGAVIVRGMVDQALRATGRPTLPRSVEVPEFKHACLGGIYALKAALRYVSCDGGGRAAIAVASDIAEYERGSSGEQTQGAGALAMLVEREPRMFRVHLGQAGTASAYRGPDFRKPLARYRVPGYAERTRRLSDFPVFSGKYSTIAYLDAVVHAVEDMLARMDVSESELYRTVEALFFHRPYQFMPIQAMSFLYVRGLTRSPEQREELEALCAAAGVRAEAIHSEAQEHPDLYHALCNGLGPHETYAATAATARVLRAEPAFQDFLARKMALGTELAAQLGNLYAAALPAWIAAALEEAASARCAPAGARMIMVGYGSGDAAEAIPLSLVEGWERAAGRIGAAEALLDPVDLSREQYEAMHDGVAEAPACPSPTPAFVISRVGDRYERDFQDLGVEYYDFARATGRTEGQP